MTIDELWERLWKEAKLPNEAKKLSAVARQRTMCLLWGKKNERVFSSKCQQVCSWEEF